MSWMENVSLVTLLFNSAFFYPVVMAFFWMVGGIYYYLRRERRAPRPDAPPSLRSQPPVSVLVPFFNEAVHIADTIHAIAAQDYASLDIIAINDGSAAATPRTLGQPRQGALMTPPPVIVRPERLARQQRFLQRAATLLAWSAFAWLWVPLITLIAWLAGLRAG